MPAPYRHGDSHLEACGAGYFILACTELPILAEGLSDPGPFVDPTEELAREAVRFCGYPVIGD